MKLSQAEQSVLRLLNTESGSDPGLSATEVGNTLWGSLHPLLGLHDGHPKPQAYARPAGKILRRLEERGLVFVESTQRVPQESPGRSSRHRFVWVITHRGAKALELIHVSVG